jgi:hypothetical protein
VILLANEARRRVEDPFEKSGRKASAQNLHHQHQRAQDDREDAKNVAAAIQ